MDIRAQFLDVVVVVVSSVLIQVSFQFDTLHLLLQMSKLVVVYYACLGLFDFLAMFNLVQLCLLNFFETSCRHYFFYTIKSINPKDFDLHSFTIFKSGNGLTFLGLS